MGSYNFKSSGKTALQRAAETLTQSPVPIGIRTPLQSGEGTQDGLFLMHYSLPDQLHDNLKNLLQCSWGERLGTYDFGANLRPLLAELASQDDFDAEAIDRISSAVNRWMPYINLDEFVSKFDQVNGQNTPIVRITITYSIPSLNVEKRSLQVVLYAI